MKKVLCIFTAMCFMAISTMSVALTLQENAEKTFRHQDTGVTFEKLFQDGRLQLKVGRWANVEIKNFENQLGETDAAVIDYHILPYRATWEEIVWNYVPRTSGETHSRLTGEFISVKLESFQADVVLENLGNHNRTVKRVYVTVTLDTYTLNRGGMIFYPLFFGEGRGKEVIIQGSKITLIGQDYDGRSVIGVDGVKERLDALRMVEIRITPTAVNGIPTVEATVEKCLNNSCLNLFLQSTY